MFFLSSFCILKIAFFLVAGAPLAGKGLRRDRIPPPFSEGKGPRFKTPPLESSDAPGEGSSDPGGKARGGPEPPPPDARGLFPEALPGPAFETDRGAQGLRAGMMGAVVQSSRQVTAWEGKLR